MRQPEDREYWESETEFCESEAISERPMGMFESYCSMQANFCKKDGFEDLAQRIAKAGKITLTDESHAAWLSSLEC